MGDSFPTRKRFRLYTLAFFLILCNIVSGGYNGCPNSEWKYHGHTHTCLTLEKFYMTWRSAQDECHEKCFNHFCHQRGWLAHVQDEKTNSFVKGLLPANSEGSYIGLYRTSWSEMILDGSTEVPKFFDFPVLSELFKGEFYAYIRKTGTWVRSDGMRLRTFICQIKADNQESGVVCPRPVKNSEHPSKPILFNCSFDFTNWKEVEWISSSSVKIGKCFQNTGHCQLDSGIRDDYQITMTDSKSTTLLTYRGEIGFQHEGSWGCTIRDRNDDVLDTKACNLTVYEPPEDITCSSNLTSQGLTVTCRTGKIYPQARCFWKYKNRAQDDFEKVSPGAIRSPEIDKNTGNKYFSTECQVQFSRDDKFLEGNFTVIVRMVPDVGKSRNLIPGKDRPSTQETVYIKKPDKPIFKFINNTVIDTDTVFYSVGDIIQIMCEIDSGIPLVYKTTMSCPFRLKNSQSIHSLESSKYILITTATSDMNGGECTCWGHHITEPTFSEGLKFGIWHRAMTVKFSSKRHLGNVALTCESSGNPTPNMTIVKKYRNGTGEILEKSKVTTTTSLSYIFTPGCLDNGAYECHSENTFKGKPFRDSKTVQVSVTCPPTSCRGSNDIPTFMRRPGAQIQITLCAFAHPIPDITKFILYKDENGKPSSAVLRTKYDISIEQEDGVLKNVIITFNNFQVDDIHPYHLIYRRTSQTKRSTLKFSLTAKGPPECPSNFTVLDVGENFISLGWTPGYSYTMQQTFTVLRFGDSPSQTPMTSLAEFQVQGDESKTYRVADLTPNTGYWLGVSTTSVDGNTTCLNDIVNATTLPAASDVLTNKDQNTGGTSGSTVTVVVVIIVILVLIVIIIGAVVLMMGKQRRKVKDAYRRDILDQGTSREQFQDDHEAYASIDPRTQPTDEVNSCVTYQNSTSVGHEGHHTETNVYSNCSPALKDNENSNLENTYSNNPPQVSLGRSRNEEGLVYVDVIIDQTSQKPQFQPTSETSLKKMEEPVEYVTIDHLATASKKNEME